MVNENQCLLPRKAKWSIWNYIPIRYFLTFMLFMGLWIAFCLRVSLSIALVAMVNITSKRNDAYIGCPNSEANFTYNFQERGEFNWNPYIQSIILGSFYYGYMFTQLPGGWLAEKFGGKWFFGGGVFWSSLLNLLFPITARAGYEYFILARIISGIGEGVTYPAMFVMMVYWSTVKERSFLLAVACVGANIGSIVSTPFAAYLCDNGFANGWPSVFYVFGICGCIWFLVWALCISNKPADHPWISKAEKLYLKQDLDPTIKQLQVPWKSIFTSVPFWALFYTRFANFWFLFTITSELPSYLESVFGMTLKQNGEESAICYIFLCIGMVSAGYISDYFRQKRYFTINVIRKLFECTGLIGCGLCLIILPEIGCNISIVITIMSIALFLFGFNTGGSTPTMVDMAPEFAGTMTGLLATLPISGAFLGPMLTGALTQGGQTIGQWNSVFYVTAGVVITGGLCFLIWGSAEVQPWAKVSTTVQNLSSSSSSTEEHINKINNPQPINAIYTSQETASP